jgi:RluA family pseudouridine synthase
MKNVPIHKEVTLVSQITNKSSQTLIEFLSKRFTYLSVVEWEGRIEAGKVVVNGHTASPGQPLRAGDEVAYTTNSWEEPDVNVNYRVVFEDDQLLAVSKPAPLPVHAIGAYFRNTLMQLLRSDRPEAQDFHLVHRLDSETSGVLLLVKDAKYLKGLQKQWSTDRVQKTYQTIVFGKFPAGARLLDAPVGKKDGSSVRMKLAVNGSEAKASTTEFSLLETRGNFSLVEARPFTGRTHQIRVHLEHLGFPIVGDKLYSGDDETFLHFYEHGWDDWLKERVLLPRVALHAVRLEFPHPITGKAVLLEDKLSEDLVRFWEGL